MWYRVTRNPQEFHRLTGGQWDSRDRGVTKYLRAAMRYVDAVGASRVEPSFAKTFATRYGPPSGVQIWCLDLLTSYVVPVPKMVCFFEAAFENDLRFPLHLFIKNVVHHFNVCPSQLSPNF